MTKIKLIMMVVLTTIHLSLFVVSHSTAGEISTANDVELAIEAFDIKSYEQAKLLFKKLNKSAKRSFYLGKIALQEKEVDDAEEYFEDAVTQEPNNVEYNYQFGALSFQQAANASIFSAMGYASDGKKYHLKALELDPNYVPALQGMIGFYINAPSIAGGSLEKAIAMTNKLIKIDEKQGLLSQLGIYKKEENQEKELAVAKALATKYAESGKVLFMVGSSFRDAKKYDEAFSYFKQASLINNEDEKFYTLLAMYQIGRTAVISEMNAEKGIKALENYRSVAQEYIITHNDLPGLNWAAYRLAALYFSVGEKDKAEKLAKMASNDKDDKKLRKRADKLLKKISRS